MRHPEILACDNPSSIYPTTFLTNRPNTPSRRQSHYQQLTEFKRGRVIGIREGGFSFRNIVERLDRNVSTVHNCWEQWSRGGNALRRPGSGRPNNNSEREDHRIRRTAVAHRTTSGKRLQPNSLWPRYTGSTPEIMVWRAFSYDSRTILGVTTNTLDASLYVSLVIQPIAPSFRNSIQVSVFVHYNDHPHTAVVTQRALQNVSM
ncbi:transposable element Tc1 transposase [Trichonephila clavipes]|nr:transposable element Tc1 transposase [Trichonephila clavipes]